MHIGIEDLRFRTSTLNQPTNMGLYTKASRFRSALSIRFVGSDELGMLLAVKALGSWRLLATNKESDSLIRKRPFWFGDHTRLPHDIPNWAPATGPPRGAPAAGVGGGESAERIPRGTPPKALAWRGGAR
jgi:hypothetical protein